MMIGDLLMKFMTQCLLRCVCALALMTVIAGCQNEFDHMIDEHCDQVAQCSEDPAQRSARSEMCQEAWYHMEDASRSEDCEAELYIYFSCVYQQNACSGDELCDQELAVYRECMSVPIRPARTPDEPDTPNKRDAAILLTILALI